MSSKFSTKIRLIAMLTTLALSGCAITDNPKAVIYKKQSIYATNPPIFSLLMLQ